MGTSRRPMSCQELQGFEVLAPDPANPGEELGSDSEVDDFRVEVGNGLRAAFGVEPVVAAGLRERAAGSWEGRTSSEIEAEFPGELARWRLGQVVHPPGAENWHMYTTRVLESLHRLAAPAEERALVVAHLGTLRVLENHLAVDPLPTRDVLGVELRTASTSMEWVTHIKTEPA